MQIYFSPPEKKKYDLFNRNTLTTLSVDILSHAVFFHYFSVISRKLVKHFIVLNFNFGHIILFVLPFNRSIIPNIFSSFVVLCRSTSRRKKTSSLTRNQRHWVLVCSRKTSKYLFVRTPFRCALRKFDDRILTISRRSVHAYSIR